MNEDAAFSVPLARRIEECGIIAVLVIDRLEDAVPLAGAVQDGGVNVIELALRTACSLGALRAITSSFPEMIVGAGTILSPKQVGEVMLAGASFGVAPGFNVRVVRAAREAGLSFAPGILTPSEIELAVENDCRVLKFFPAEPAGGLNYLKTVTVPFAHLNLQFIPLGGLNVQNMASYSADPQVLAIGGSWLTPRSLVESRNWTEIRRLCREATNVISDIRSSTARR
jgi:2-dehydro-3-deoxyphosphogluconate aldolase/(4S)-4-hydroxy-2-oxoglutarate aldolase